MTIFYVVTNGLHTTVITSGDEDNGQGEVSKEEALELAVSKFKDAGLDASGLAVACEIDDEEEPVDAWGDGPEDIGLSDGVFIEAASQLQEDNVSVDSDAVVSGFNVMSWMYTEPSDVLYHLARNAPIAVGRSMPPRDSRHDAALEAGRAAVAAFDAFQANPDSASLTALAAVMKNLDSALEGKDGSKVALSSVIQSWESAESSAEFEAMTDDQRKPWKVEVEHTSANQLTVAVWPANQNMADATSGLGLYIEIDKGVPTVHVAPSPNQENACHIRQLSSHEVRVTPGTRLPERDDQEGSGPGYVFTNGSP